MSQYASLKSKCKNSKYCKHIVSLNLAFKVHTNISLFTSILNVDVSTKLSEPGPVKVLNAYAVRIGKKQKRTVRNFHT